MKEKFIYKWGDINWRIRFIFKSWFYIRNELIKIKYKLENKLSGSDIVYVIF